MYGSRCWTARASAQGAVALSSVEAEFFAMVEGTQRGKRALTLATQLRLRMAGGGIVVKTNSEVAKSFVSRTGLERMRHTDGRESRLQEMVRMGKAVVKKVAGAENPVDLLTKFLKTSGMVERLRRMGIDWQDGTWTGRLVSRKD